MLRPIKDKVRRFFRRNYAVAGNLQGGVTKEIFALSVVGDPLISVLRNKLCLSKTRCFFLLTLGNLCWLVLGDMSVWLAKGHQIFKFSVTGGFYLSDPLIGTPAIVLAYLWSSDAFAQMFRRLINEQVIASNKCEAPSLKHIEFLEKIRRRSEFQRWAIVTAVPIATSLYWLYFVYAAQLSVASQTLSYPYWPQEPLYFWLVSLPRRTLDYLHNYRSIIAVLHWILER